MNLQNRVTVLKDVTSRRKRDPQNLPKHPQRPFSVTNKYPENQDIFNSSKFSAGMKTYVGVI